MSKTTLSAIGAAMILALALGAAPEALALGLHAGLASLAAGVCATDNAGSHASNSSASTVASATLRYRRIRSLMHTFILKRGA